MNRIRSKALAGVLVLMTACGTGAAAGIAAGTGTRDGTTTSSTSVMASASTGDEPIVDVVAATTPSVVTVTSEIQSLSPFGSSQGKAVGTGFVVRSDGYIVTNHHVVADASSVSVTLSNGDVHTATVVAQDEEHDLAVLKIDADHPAVERQERAARVPVVQRRVRLKQIAVAAHPGRVLDVDAAVQ